jgi:pSer/pThr/pTyr-binding forkhead associated (FHA) protein
MSENGKEYDKVTSAEREDTEYLLHRIVPDNLVVYLLVLEGKRKGERIYLRESPLFVGRDKGMDIILDDPSVSREHAVLYYYKNRFEIKDLGSTNGIIINGKRCIDKGELKNKDTIKIGKILLRFMLETK